MRPHSKGWLWTREVVSLTARTQQPSADLEWEWTLRADGCIWSRLTRVRGRLERNDWRYAGQLDGPAWKALAAGQLAPADLLERHARGGGHRLAIPARHAAQDKCPACGALASQETGGGLQPHQRPSQDWPARFIPCPGRRPKRR